MIERKYLRLRKGVVAEYRRIKTPFFYINLKPRQYKHYDYKMPFISLGPFGLHPTPNGELIRYQGWKDYKGGVVLNRDLESLLSVTNEAAKDNVLRLSA